MMLWLGGLVVIFATLFLYFRTKYWKKA
jgi:hypothetical protein